VPIKSSRVASLGFPFFPVSKKEGRRGGGGGKEGNNVNPISPLLRARATGFAATFLYSHGEVDIGTGWRTCFCPPTIFTAIHLRANPRALGGFTWYYARESAGENEEEMTKKKKRGE
jgi:hypothetical protein